MIAFLFTHGSRKLPSGIPVASSNSIAIRSTCHGSNNDTTDAILQPLKYGALSTTSNRLQHTGLSSGKLEPLLDGETYAGLPDLNFELITKYQNHIAFQKLPLYEQFHAFSSTLSRRVRQQPTNGGTRQRLLAEDDHRPRFYLTRAPFDRLSLRRHLDILIDNLLSRSDAAVSDAARNQEPVTHHVEAIETLLERFDDQRLRSRDELDSFTRDLLLEWVMLFAHTSEYNSARPPSLPIVPNPSLISRSVRSASIYSIIRKVIAYLIVCIDRISR